MANKQTNWRRSAVARLTAIGMSSAEQAERLNVSRTTIANDLAWLRENRPAELGFLPEIAGTLRAMAVEAALENDYRKMIEIAKAVIGIETHQRGPAGRVIDAERMSDIAAGYIRAVEDHFGSLEAAAGEPAALAILDSEGVAAGASQDSPGGVVPGR